MLTRRTLRRALILETIAIGMIEYITGEGYLSLCLPQVKNLIFYIHQNYILICDAVLAKLSQNPDSSHNIWTTQLRNTITLKKSAKMKKGEYWAMLASNNTTIAYLAQTISKNIRLASSQDSLKKEFPVLNCVANIFKQVEKISVSQARDVLTKALLASVFLNK